ncbi:MAG: CBS domain-containing protein [Burkholderiales bacterium]|nr:CBS domain-containing protein [Burkholderiales bacterium]
MTLGALCSRDVVVADRDATVREVAALMRERHVGCVVLVRAEHGRRVPSAIITDRDIVVAVTALGLDPEVIRAGDVGSSELYQIAADAGLAEAVALMRLKGVRRLPVVGAGGELVGLIAADDVVGLLAEEMAGLAAAIDGERKREAAKRRTRKPAR